jgi:hypothetical protein
LALPFARFQVEQVLIAVLADALQLVELGVVAERNDAAFAQDRRRLLDDRANQQRMNVRIGASSFGEIRQRRRIEPGEQALQLRQSRQSFAQLREVTRTRRLQRDARETALDVADMCQRVVQSALQPFVDQRADRLQAQLDRAPISQRPMQPAAQLAAAHRSRSSIEHGSDGAVRPIRKTRGELQIAARRCVEQNRFAALFGAQAAQVRQRSLLRIAHILQKAARCRDGERAVGTAEAGQIARLELLTQRARRGLHVEVPRRALADEGRRAGGLLRLLGNEQLCRPQPLDLASQRLIPFGFEHAEAAARQLEPGQTEPVFVPEEGGQQRVAALFQKCLVRHRARSDDAHDLTLDRPLRLGRIADLLADRDRLAASHELRQITFDAVERHARHRYRLAGGLPARRQRDVEQSRGALGVVVEQLVEIAHAIEQQRVRVLRLQAQVLLHHRRVL